MRRFAVLAVLACLPALPAVAEFDKITEAEAFRRLVAGKTLSHPLFKLTVSPEGAITGHGIRREVRGQWRWQDGYFCRALSWGDKDLGYNCQRVDVNGSRIRFTSDRGRGESAVFRLRPR